MSVHLHSTTQRLALALAFSLLLHALFFWLPDLALPHVRTPLPLLAVRMEPAAQKPIMPVATETKPVVVPAARPQHAVPKPAIPGLSLVDQSASGVFAAPAPPAASIAAPASGGEASGIQAAATTDYAPNRNKSNIPALPLHAQLRFAVYLGGSGVSIGDLFQELDISGERYTLLAQLEKAGLASWFNSSQLMQSSRGTLSAIGDLVPEEFKEEATSAQGAPHFYDAAFDWNARQLRFADGTASPLPSGTQDMLSLLYQLSQYSYTTEKFALALTDGPGLREIRLEVGETEKVATPMGTLSARHLHQLRDQDAPGMEIWLGADYRMLPVKLQKIQPDGRISEEWVVKEIRVSDEQPTK